METTRRYPRSMSEAFPDERAQWFESELKPAPALRSILAATIVAACIAAAIWWLTYNV